MNGHMILAVFGFSFLSCWVGYYFGEKRAFNKFGDGIDRLLQLEKHFSESSVESAVYSIEFLEGIVQKELNGLLVFIEEIEVTKYFWSAADIELIMGHIKNLNNEIDRTVQILQLINKLG